MRGLSRDRGRVRQQAIASVCEVLPGLLSRAGRADDITLIGVGGPAVVVPARVAAWLET
jgi:hypothetical protein